MSNKTAYIHSGDMFIDDHSGEVWYVKIIGSHHGDYSVLEATPAYDEETDEELPESEWNWIDAYMTHSEVCRMVSDQWNHYTDVSVIEEEETDSETYDPEN